MSSVFHSLCYCRSTSACKTEHVTHLGLSLLPAQSTRTTAAANPPHPTASSTISSSNHPHADPFTTSSPLRWLCSFGCGGVVAGDSSSMPSRMFWFELIISSTQHIASRTKVRKEGRAYWANNIRRKNRSRWCEVAECVVFHLNKTKGKGLRGCHLGIWQNRTVTLSLWCFYRLGITTIHCRCWKEVLSPYCINKPLLHFSIFLPTPLAFLSCLQLSMLLSTVSAVQEPHLNFTCMNQQFVNGAIYLVFVWLNPLSVPSEC